MKFSVFIAFALVGTLLGEANPDAVRENQRVTVEMFPELGVKDSPLNKRFVGRVQRYQAEKSKLFDSYDWPYRIAEECVKELKLDQKVSESLKRATELFPELQREGSPLHRLFVESSNEYRELHTSIPVSEDWPYRIAEQSFEELKKASQPTAHAVTPPEEADKRGAFKAPTSSSAAATTAAPAEKTKSRVGTVAITIVILVVALVAFIRSPSNFLRILIDLFGLGSARELGRRLSGAPPSSTYSRPKPTENVQTYDVRMVVRTTTGSLHHVKTRVSAQNSTEARHLIMSMHPGATSVVIQETRQ